MMIFELSLKGRAGVSPGDTWERAFLAEGTVSAKVKGARWARGIAMNPRQLEWRVCREGRGHGIQVTMGPHRPL